MQEIYTQFVERRLQHKKSFAVLVDPDKTNEAALSKIITFSIESKVDYIFMGGSLVVLDKMDSCIRQIKSACKIPVVLFPGAPSQVSTEADALLYLSLISGRNPELLIGQHVLSAPMIKSSGLEIIPTGYIVVDGGAPTAVSYISNTAPIPADKNDIAVCTVMAGEMLGLKLMYMDAGSGAKNPVSTTMIERVVENINVPLIVGGGITDAMRAEKNCKAGADIIVVGNAIEKAPNLIKEIAQAVHECN